MKKVLFVINTLGAAGAEMALQELLEYLPKEEYELSLYVLLEQGTLEERIPSNVIFLNKSYKHCSVLTGKGRREMARTVSRAMVRRATGLRQLPYYLGAFFEMCKKRRIQIDKLLWRTLSEGAPRFSETYDLAVAFLEGGSTYYVADHVRARKKAAFVHVDYQVAGYSKFLDQGCYKYFDIILPIAASVRTSFLGVYPEYEGITRIFPNIINQPVIRSKAKQEGGFKDEYEGLRLLSVGRLHYQKGYDIAIRAMKQLKDKGIRARWYVLGDGPEHQNLRREIQDLDLEQDFILCGAKDNPYPYFAQADIYIHATRFEGKSIAIQEAQTLGCAIIGSDIPENRALISHEENGLLCPLTPEGVAAAIERLAKDKGLRERLGSRAGSILYTPDDSLRLFQELMEEA